MKIGKKFLSVILASTLFASSLNAGGLADFIQNNLNGAIETTNPGYFKTQTGGLWYGGDMKIRWDMSGANINLFHAEAPHFAVGCSGIDATFGSFSYLGFQQLVDKLKKISAAAPAMAFQMAIMTMCEQCNTIMTNLEKIADTLNNFNINACQASKALARKMSSVIVGTGGAKDATEVRTNARENSEWAFTRALEGYQQKFGSILGTNGFHAQLGHGSAIENVAKTYSPSFMNKEQFIEVMRGLIGDVYGFDMPSQDSSGADNTAFGKFLYITPKTNVGDFLEALMYGGKIYGVKVTPEKQGEHYLPPKIEVVNIDIPQDQAFVTLFKNKIQTIINKIQSRQPLTTEEINFINSMPIPLYNIANVIATLNLDLPDDTAKYLALKAARTFIQKYYSQVVQALGSILKNPKFATTENQKVLDWIQQSANQYRGIMTLLNTKMMMEYKRIQAQKDIIEQYQKMQKDMIKNSPIWASLGL